MILVFLATYLKIIISVLVINFCFFGNLFCKDLFSDYREYQVSNTKLKIKKVTDGLDFAWGMTFIDKTNLIITQKNGKLLRVNTQNGKTKVIKHKIDSLHFDGAGQGGLLDVLYHNGFLYFSYSHDFSLSDSKKHNSGSATAIAKGQLVNDEIVNLKILLIAKPRSRINKHFGSRLLIKGNHLYASFGERDLGMIAQDASKHPGSIIRINLDGSIPTNNPAFNKHPDWLPEIFQIGVRNPQGITISPHDGNIYISQHGPRGGDNIGKIKHAGNFGWKDVAWGGKEYHGTKIGKEAFKDKYNDHLITWVPSIGVGQISFYKGKTFKEWDGDLIVSATGAGLLLRLIYKNKKVYDKEIIVNKTLGRIRDFEINFNGDIYIIIDDANAALWKLSK